MKTKKLLTALLAGTMLASCVSFVSAFAEGEINNPLFNAPMIPEGYSVKVDGKMDDIWTAVEPQKIERVDDFEGVDTKTDGTIRFLWDDTGYYCFVEVDKHGVDMYSTCKGEDIRSNDDTVAFGFVNGGADGFWTHPGTENYAYCGLVFGGDLDGNVEKYGWYRAYGSEDQLQYKIRQTASDKFCVELFVSWVGPMRADVYGAAGVGEGSVIMFDAVIYDHNPEDPSQMAYVSWSQYPYVAFNGSQHFGYLVLADEADPDDIKTVEETPETQGEAEPTPDDPDADVTTPDATPDPTANGNKKNADNGKKKENSPKTLDVASVAVAVSVLSLGALVITKKKHR